MGLPHHLLLCGVSLLLMAESRPCVAPPPPMLLLLRHQPQLLPQLTAACCHRRPLLLLLLALLPLRPRLSHDPSPVWSPGSWRVEVVAARQAAWTAAIASTGRASCSNGTKRQAAEAGPSSKTPRRTGAESDAATALTTTTTTTSRSRRRREMAAIEVGWASGSGRGGRPRGCCRPPTRRRRSSSSWRHS